ncbi:hypothetical protein J6W32_01260 [bacterium]|nr:hypothetical protein [bacterium]MBP5783229.1 hypothetical protein [bacterium]
MYQVNDVNYQLDDDTLNLSYQLTTTYNVAPVENNVINTSSAINNVAQVTSLITINNATIAPCLVNYCTNPNNNLMFNVYGG